MILLNCIIIQILWAFCGNGQVSACEEPPDIDFGEIVSDEKLEYRESDKVQYKCNSGYSLTGPEWIICIGKTWTPAPQCLAPCTITKQQLEAKNLLLSNGRRRTQLIHSDHTLGFMCSKGYAITIPSVRKCGNGHMDLPSCISETGKNCSRPPIIENGDITTFLEKEYTSGSFVEFKCQKYYAMEGQNTSFCDNGNWTKVPLCLEPCTLSVKEMENQMVELNGTANESILQHVYLKRGDFLNLRCKRGYALATNFSQSTFLVQCNGQPIVYPECKEIVCGPPVVVYGKYKPQRSMYRDGDIIIINCDPEFLIDNGQKTAECTQNGWLPPSSCNMIICETPTIQNGNIVSLKRVYKEEERLQFTCNAGYTFSERPDAECTENGWHPIPACKEISCDPPRVNNGTYHPQRRVFREEDEITVSCDHGFHFETDNRGNRAKCTKNGWVPIPKCILRPCDFPNLENGVLSGYYEYYRERAFPAQLGVVVPYKCNKGYTSTSEEEWNSITCTREGWNPMPKCLKKCSPYFLVNGKYQYLRGKTYKEGDEISYVCEPEYSPANQQAKVTCTKNDWSPTPRCISNQRCENIQIQNGHVYESQDRFNLNEEATYVCQTGYTTPERKERGKTQCLQEGWSPFPKCIKTCKTPNFENINFLTNKMVFLLKERLEYECADGYQTVNKITTGQTVCGINGWTPEPQCQTIECEMLTLPQGRISPRKGKYANGDVVKFSCSKNYIRVGPDSSQCYYFGWFPASPTCKEKTKACGPPPSITNGNINSGGKEKYEHGDSVVYGCKLRFKMIGSSKIECIDGEWTSSPSCTEEEKTCGPPPSIPQGNAVKVDHHQYVHGESVEYECDENYGTAGTKTAKCVSGKWTSLPSCVEKSAKCEIPEDFEKTIIVTTKMQEKYNWDEVVKYQCKPGAKTVKQATCKYGEWSPKLECEEINLKCPPPPQLPGTINITDTRNYENGEKITFTCLKNFEHRGVREIMCENGKWQSPPRCIATSG